MKFKYLFFQTTTLRHQAVLMMSWRILGAVHMSPVSRGLTKREMGH